MEIIFAFFLALLMLGASMYANINMLNKTEKYEDAIELLQKQNTELEQFIQQFSDNLSLIDKQLKEIDTKGVFAADDEVGYTFNAIKLITSQLQTFNINYYAQDEKG